MPVTVCEPWPLAPDCVPEGFPVDPPLWDDSQRLAVEAASGILKALSGGVYGLCTLKIRPCRRRCLEYDSNRLLRQSLGVIGGPWTPTLVDGRLYNISCGCVGGCGCSALSEIILDPFAYDITQIRLDGAVLATSAYRVDDNRRLVRIDGGHWPDCQELAKPDTEPGTFSVAYRTGYPVPAGGRMAVTDLSVQLWNACRGASCKLPARVTQVVREGITYQLIDDLSVFDRGRTGLSRVDLWLASVNPHSARSPMRVFSPDTIRSRRTTWPP